MKTILTTGVKTEIIKNRVNVELPGTANRSDTFKKMMLLWN